MAASNRACRPRFPSGQAAVQGELRLDQAVERRRSAEFEAALVGDVVDGAHPGEERLAVVLEHVADLGVGQRFAVEQFLARVLAPAR